MQETLEVRLAETAAFDIKYVGSERTPIIIVDNYASEIAPVIKHACKQEYTVDTNSYYPGRRAKAPKSYVYSLLKPIYEKLRQVYQVPEHMRFQPRLGYYSLVTTEPEKLSALQRIPHFDSNNTYYLAVLHYLNEGSFGGTAFYRHRETGFERITSERRDHYLRSLQKQLDDFGELEAKYIIGDTELFQQIALVGYKPNRLVVYPGNLLHSGIINSEVDLHNDPMHGRLTGNIFAEFISQ